MKNKEREEYENWNKSREIANSLEGQDLFIYNLMSKYLIGSEIEKSFKDNAVTNCMLSDDYKILSDSKKINYINEIFKKEINETIKREKEKHIIELFQVLTEFKIGQVYYYKHYEKIKKENDYTQDEKDFAYNLGYDNFSDWTFAFIILAYRNSVNDHFLKLFSDTKFESIDINDLNSLKFYSTKFYNSYNIWKSRNT